MLLQRLNLQSWVGDGAQMKVVILSHVYDWSAWPLGRRGNEQTQACNKISKSVALRLSHLGTHMHGALLDTTDGVHSFTFMRRHGG